MILRRTAWALFAAWLLAAWPVFAADVSPPATNAFAVTPSDTQTIPETTWIYVGGQSGAQTLTVTMAGNAGGGTGNKVTFTGIPVGFAQLRVNQIWSTGTTVTNIVALY